VLDPFAVAGTRGRLFSPSMMEEPRSWETRLIGINSNSGPDHMTELRAEPPDFVLTQGLGGATGVDAGLKEHLVRDPIPHPRGKPLIQQHGLDVAPSFPEQFGKLAGLGHREKGIKAESANRRVVPGVVPQTNPAQPPRVGHDQLAAAIDDEMDLRKTGRPFT
jgi:hypothetical protein